MIGTVGDLVEDVVVHLRGPVNVASDTDARVLRRRGGSAANMAVAVARAGGRSRFIGQVGDDPLGALLIDALVADGVEPIVRRGGRTGTIVVLVDLHGERTMLRDRAACVDLDRPEPSWLDGLEVLHVPVYSLVGGPLAATATTLVGLAHERGIRVSVDASSAAELQAYGVERAVALLRELRPDVLLCNELEAEVLGGAAGLERVGAPLTFEKHGPGECVVTVASEGVRTAVPAERIDDVRDTTGAGDAFAAGLLLALCGGADPVSAAVAGHAVAADAIRRASAEPATAPWSS